MVQRSSAPESRAGALCAHHGRLLSHPIGIQKHPAVPTQVHTPCYIVGLGTVYSLSAEGDFAISVRELPSGCRLLLRGKHRIPGTQPTAVGGAVLCRMPAWGHPSSSAEGLTVIAVLNALFSGWGPGPLDLQRPRGWWCCPACPSSADVSVGRLTLLPSPCHGMETAAFCGPCLNPALPTVCSGGF